MGRKETDGQMPPLEPLGSGDVCTKNYEDVSHHRKHSVLGVVSEQDMAL